ncbi:MAG: CPBP family intramembrane metalloprotease [Oscillospiraceae bacterium]|nr:CPBP family intramembrane metalloprotease [Oscillospiraceae bacterium]
MSQPAQNLWFAGQAAHARQRERHGIRRLSRILGGSLLLVCGLQQLYGLLVTALSVSLIPKHPLWEVVLSLAGTVLLLTPGALLGLRLLSPWEQNQALPFGRPFAHNGRRGALLALAVIFAGMMVCLAGSSVSGLIAGFAQDHGIRFEAPALSAAADAPEFLLRILSTAIAPAVIEELLLRGVILQPLRRYGDAFAVLISALLFALLHQNLLQAPMAFISGLALGYAAVWSGSLWPGIILHFLNNAASVTITQLLAQLPEARTDRFVRLYGLTVYALGLLGALYLLLNRKRLPAANRPFLNTGRLRLTGRFLFGSLPMGIVLALLLASFALTTHSG